MVNLKPTNVKLKNRMVSIVSEIVGCDSEKAQKLLQQNDWDIKKAVKNSDNL